MRKYSHRIKNGLRRLIAIREDTRPATEGTFDVGVRTQLDKMFGRRRRKLIEKLFVKK